MTSKNHQNSEEIHVELSKLWPTPAGSRKWCVHASGFVFQWCLPPQPFLEAYCTLNFRCSIEGLNPLNHQEIPSTVVKFYQKIDRSKDVFPSIADPRIIYMYHLLSVFFLNRFRLDTPRHGLVSSSASSNWGIPDMFLTMDSSFASGSHGWRWGDVRGDGQQQPTVAAQDATVAPNSAGKRS